MRLYAPSKFKYLVLYLTYSPKTKVTSAGRWRRRRTGIADTETPSTPSLIYRRAWAPNAKTSLKTGCRGRAAAAFVLRKACGTRRLTATFTICGWRVVIINSSRHLRSVKGAESTGHIELNRGLEAQSSQG